MAQTDSDKKNLTTRTSVRESDPQSWPALVWRLKWVLLVIIGVIFGGYFALRVASIDLLERPLAYVNAKIGKSDAGDFPTSWDYTCFTDEGNWGGTASITSRKTRWGTEISIVGERTWISSKEPGAARQFISPAIAWTSEGGTYASNDSLQWYYRTNPDNARIEGMTQVKIIRDDDRVVKLNGRFSTTFDRTAKFGQIEMLPRKN
jgi:hypothetical protein